MQLLNVRDDNASFFQTLAQAKRRVLVVDYDSLTASRSDEASGIPWPSISELLDCIMTTSHTQVVLVTTSQAARLAGPAPGPAPDIWESDGPASTGAMLSRLGDDTAVAFLIDPDQLPAGRTPAGAEPGGPSRNFVQFLVDWLRVCGGEIC